MMQHEEANLTGTGGLNLYYQCWLPEVKPRAVLIIAHGLADHSGRYNNLVDYFVPRNFAVFAFDFRGHGKSDGKRCYINRFAEYIADLRIFIETIREKYPDRPLYLVAHSMGTSIAIPYLIQYRKEVDGLITSGANLSSKMASPFLVAIAGLLSMLVPKMGVKIIDANLISRDPEVVSAYVNDPLVFRGKIPARTGAELIGIWRKLPSQIPELKLPLLVLQGEADGLSMPAGSRILYDKASSADKTIKIYEGFYHEIFNEPEHEMIMRDIEGWLNARI